MIAERRDAWPARAPDADARWQQTVRDALLLSHAHDDDPLALSLGWHDSALQYALLGHGWPATAVTRAYLQAALAGAAPAARPPLRRTALVTTRAYGVRTGAPLAGWRTGRPEPPFLYDGRTDQRVENVPGWELTPALQAAAGPVLRRHRAALARWFLGAQAPLAAGSFAAQPGRPALTTDYPAAVEALLPTVRTYAQKLVGKPATLARKVVVLLDKTYHRVYSRRSQAGVQPVRYPGGQGAFRRDTWERLRLVAPTLPPTPPEFWPRRPSPPALPCTAQRGRASCSLRS